jgi:uncharacterized protein YpuA (DUF1002 family)
MVPECERVYNLITGGRITSERAQDRIRDIVADLKWSYGLTWPEKAYEALCGRIVRPKNLEATLASIIDKVEQAQYLLANKMIRFEETRTILAEFISKRAFDEMRKEEK